VPGPWRSLDLASGAHVASGHRPPRPGCNPATLAYVSQHGVLAGVNRMSRTTRLIWSLIIGTVAVGAINVAAAAEATSAAIGPNQSFIGQVNGTHPKATIKVVCPGPVRPPPFAQSGHPLADQTLGVAPAPSTTAHTGFTGSRVKSITATFVLPVDAPTVPVTFTHYGSQPIPTSLLLPCSGSAPVVFSPQPTSKTARSASVTVTYENVAVTDQVARTAACQGTIDLSHLAFSPRSVTAGETSTAHLTALNCTGTSQQAEVTWLGRFTANGTGIPAGCPAIDPLAQGISFGAHGSAQGHVGYTVPSSCRATGLEVTARITGQGGTVLASRMTVLKITG